MRRTNWSNFEKAAKAVKKVANADKQMLEFFSDFPQEGYMRDNISKNHIKISDCKSSSLRRYVSLLNNFFYTAKTEKSKEIILKKKIEIEKELNTREDGLL